MDFNRRFRVSPGFQSLLVCCAIGAFWVSASTAFAQHVVGNGAAALDSIFNVRTAPDAKSMGIFQGSFLDAIRPESPGMQIAFVIDVTESMADELPGIRDKIPQVVADLKRATAGKVEVALVTFADSGDGKKPLTGLDSGFTADEKALTQAVAALEPRSGRPYFPEAVDLAIYNAIRELPWSDAENQNRWLMLITDAPPYDASFEEEKTHSRRWYETDVLVNLANQRGISIHGLLCQSRKDEKAAFEASLDKTRHFMGQLTSRTGGLMLDLSFQQIQEKVARAAQRPRADFAYVGAIGDADIVAVKQRMAEKVGDLSSLRVAVLPHLAWEDMTFYHEVPGVQWATQLRYSLKRLPGIVTISSREIEAEFLRLKAGPVERSQWPQALCLRLGADLLIVGDLRTNGDVSDVQSKLYVARTAEPVAAISASGARESLVPAYLTALKQAKSNQGPIVLLAKAAASEQATDLREFWPGILADMSSEVQSQLLSAMELIEKSVDVSLAAEERLTDLQQAIGLLEPHAAEPTANGFLFSLLASAYFNVAKTQEEQGQAEAGQSDMQKSIIYLTKAYDARRMLADRLLQAEIEADYALLVQQDFSGAVGRYQQITQFNEASPLRMALRAHWMLAGIHCGDWGAAKNGKFQPNPQAARDHLIHILAFWPESQEAKVIEKYMRWDENHGKTGTPYFPKEGELLLTAN